MQKPQGYDQAQAAGQYTPITPGPHRCVILAVEETYSSAGNEMLKITVDTDRTDSQPEHFKNLDRKPSKSLVTDGRTEYGVPNLKGFITAVEVSNPGFQTFWGDKYQFEAQFRGKRIGCCFGEEEYLNDKNEKKVAVKPRYFFDYAKCQEQRIPARKPLENAGQRQYQQPTVQSAQMPYQQPAQQYQQQTMNQYQAPQQAPPQAQGFMNIDPVNDPGLPFA